MGQFWWFFFFGWEDCDPDGYSYDSWSYSFRLGCDLRLIGKT